MKATNTHRLIVLANFGLSLDGMREGEPKTSVGLPPLDIVDDRTFEEKVRDGDVISPQDEPYCDRCCWPQRLCVCAAEAIARNILPVSMTEGVHHV